MKLADMLIDFFQNDEPGLEIGLFIGFVSGFVEEEIGKEGAQVLFELAYEQATKFRSSKH